MSIFKPKNTIQRVEKLELETKERIDFRKYIVELYEPYKIAQRVLAFIVLGIFLGVHIVTAVTHYVYIIKDKEVEKLFKLYEYNLESLGDISLIVAGFYFGAGAVEGVVNKIRNRIK